MKKCSLFLAVAISLLLVQTAAANLVVNGGFETGDFTGWTQSGDTTYAFVSSYFPPYSGNYCADFGSTSPKDMNVITQTFATIPGQSYYVSFWLANYDGDPQGHPPSQFQAAWNGANFYNEIFPEIAFGWTQYTKTLQATDYISELAFRFYQWPSYFTLDDVSASAVPIPGSLVLLTSVLLPLGWRRLRQG